MNCSQFGLMILTNKEIVEVFDNLIKIKAFEKNSIKKETNKNNIIL